MNKGPTVSDLFRSALSHARNGQRPQAPAFRLRGDELLKLEILAQAEGISPGLYAARLVSQHVNELIPDEDDLIEGEGE